MIEDQAFGVFGQSGGPLLSRVWALLPGPNAATLANAFGGAAGAAGSSLADAERAALTLTSYTAVALAVSAILLVRRDVT